jgi:uncharacterized damage-inducible protein DinB
MKTYRPGATGALLDIYAEAITSLKETISTIPDHALAIIIDPDTRDANCKSIQSILSHVVYSGYGYVTSINNLKPDKLVRPERVNYSNTNAYLQELDNVFTYTENILSNWQDEELEQLDNTLKIATGWGQQYDPEQLLEHAIVHIVRHNRQIEKMKAHSLLYQQAVVM